MPWDELREYKNYDLGFSPEDLANLEGSYRAAYPAYRVFIYGKEVTRDVTDVRVNQAGGSAERIPSGCSITLQNKHDEYIINHADMLAISSAMGKAPKDLDTQIRDIRFDRLTMYSELMFDVDQMLYDQNYEGAYELLSSLDWFDMDVSSQALTFNEDGTTTLNRDKLASLIMDALKKYKKRFNGVATIDWDDAYYTSSSLKQEVLEKKMAYKSEVVPVYGPNFEGGDREIIFEYPMQEGMCIFHQNDPVRVAFRDPFDPRMWYWMFSGFIDTTTENSGVNKESSVSITCTDVSKMARYTTLISNNFLDPNMADRFGDGTAFDIGVTFYNEILADLTIFEILETLFFGTGSAAQGITERVAAMVKEDMSEEEIHAALVDTLDRTGEEFGDIFELGVKDYGGAMVATATKEGKDTDYFIKNIDRAREVLFKRRKGQKKQQLLRFKGDPGGITHPRGVRYRRKSKSRGVHVFFKGELDETDKIIGENVTDLWHWNEIIHHRVRRDDILDMYAEAEDDVDETIRKTAYIGGKINSRDFPYDPSMMTIGDIITTIGTDLDHYPVGAGRVFLLMPATVESRLDRGILDKGLTSGLSSMHSKFRDRLSVLYDLANRIDFRCYATPKGDFVFEMPFYDFNVDAFFNQRNKSDAWDQEITNKQLSQQKLKVYEEIFRQQYTGDYDAESVQDLTKLRMEIADLETMGYSKVATTLWWSVEPYFDYAQQFILEDHEMLGYSDTSTDQGVYTFCLAQRNTVANFEDFNNTEFARQQGDARRLVPMLGFRVLEEDVWGFTDTDEQAAYYCNLTLNRVNAEQRNLGISTIPHFGLMVNRPLFWSKRHYQGCIVSMQHSIVWNSSCDTSINLNQIRAWDGDRNVVGKPTYKHLAGDRPFDLSRIFDFDKVKNRDKKGVV